MAQDEEREMNRKKLRDYRGVPPLPDVIPPPPPRLPKKIMGIPITAVLEYRTLPDEPLTLADWRCYIKRREIE
jgi:hypothetical protein